MLFDLAVSVATGTPFLGMYPVEKIGPVIIVQQEDPHSDIASRLSEIINARLGIGDRTNDSGSFELALPPNIPIFLHEDRSLHFEDPASMESLYAVVQSVQPALVIVDPLYSAASTDDYMAKATTAMLGLKTIRDRCRTSFAIAHHTKKRVGTDTDREGAWGSTFLNAWLETGWQIRAVENQPNTVNILRHFKVRGGVPPVQLKFDIETETDHRYRVEVVEEDEVGPSGILDQLQAGPMSVADLAEALGTSKEAVRETLRRMRLDGLVSNKGQLWKLEQELPSL